MIPELTNRPTRLIELCRTGHEFEPETTRWFANGVRVSQEQYEFLDVLGQNKCCLLTTNTGSLWRHSLTVTVPTALCTSIPERKF